MLKKIHLLSLTFIILTSYSCHKNPIERNTIVFKDNHEKVQNALISMAELISILPKPELNTNYYFKDNNIYINSSFVGTINSIKLDTIKALENFNIKQKEDFLRLAKYLKGNYITAGYIDESRKNLYFEYRELDDDNFNDHRDIVLCKESDSASLKFDKILDHKDMVFLVAAVGTKIY